MKGERYSKIVSINNKDMFDRVKLKKASAVIIDGSLGEGKTTLAVHLGDEINEFNGLPPINFEEQLALGGADFVKKIQVCYEKKLPVIIYDEAGDYTRKGALSSFNKALNNVFETFRAYKLVVILCLPYFNTLDSSLFKFNAVRLLFHCSDRTQTYGEIRGYDIDKMGWLRANMDKYKYREWEAYNKVLPIFRANFWNLEEQRCNELDTYCTKGKIKILKKAGVNLNNFIDLKTLAFKLDMSKQWVTMKLKELKIRPETRLARTFYYNKDSFEKLRMVKSKGY